MRDPATSNRLFDLASTFLTDRRWSPENPRVTPILLLSLSGGLAGALTGFVLAPWCTVTPWMQGDGFAWDVMDLFAIIGLAVGLTAGVCLAMSRNLIIRVTLSGGLGILLVALAVAVYAQGRRIFVWGSCGTEEEMSRYQGPLGWGLFLGGPTAAALALGDSILRRCRGKPKLQLLVLAFATLVLIRAQAYFWDNWDRLRWDLCTAPCHMSCYHDRSMALWPAGLLLGLCTGAIQLWVDLLSLLFRKWSLPYLVPAILSLSGICVLGLMAWGGKTMAWVTPARIARIEFTEDPGIFLTQHEGETVRRWRIVGGTPDEIPAVELLETQRLRRGPVRAGEYASCRSMLGTGSVDGFAALWDSNTYQRLAEVQTEGEWPRVQISGDGRILATCSRHGPLKVWTVSEDCMEIKPRCTLIPGSSGEIRTFAIAPRSHRIAVITLPDRLTLYEPDNLKPLSVYPYPCKSCFDPPLFSSSERYLAFPSATGGLMIIDQRLGKSVSCGSSRRPLCFSPDSTILAASTYESIHLIEVGTGRCLRTLSKPDEFIAAAFSPDGRWLLLAGVRCDFDLFDCSRLNRR